MYDIIIIGGGIAGLSAAIHSARSGPKTLVLDNGLSAITNVDVINDFPGFPEGISGADLIKRMREQASAHGAEVRMTRVTGTTLGETAKKAIAIDNTAYDAKTVILATGNQAIPSHTVHGEKELTGKGVSYNAATDAPLFKKRVAALAGKTEEIANTAIALSKYAEKVVWIIPASNLDVADQTKASLEKISNIEPLFSSSLKEVLGSDRLTGVKILTGGEEKEIAVDGLFLPPPQYKPQVDYLSGIALAEDGSVLVDNELATSIPGVFACGNILCAEPQLHAVCAAQGMIAAMGVVRYLK